MRLFLWDIDSTLLTTGRVTREAYYAAASQVLGEPLVDDGSVHFSGKTDPQIGREILLSAGLSPDAVNAKLRRLVRTLGTELALRLDDIRSRGHVLPGVRDILPILNETRNVTTVLTGNIAVNAVLKLDAFRLTPFLDMEVGAYGSDTEHRVELVDIARERAAERRRAWCNDEDVWIIGDSPGDYAAAHQNGIRCLLVATGAFEHHELEALGPDAAMKDLSDTDAVVELLLNG